MTGFLTVVAAFAVVIVVGAYLAHRVCVKMARAEGNHEFLKRHRIPRKEARRIMAEIRKDGVE